MDFSIFDSESKPELIGIGVRLAIYIQALLPILPQITTFVVAGGRPASVPRKDVATSGLLSSVYILVTGYALIFSAIIQAKTRHLAAYHAHIILNLNWLISFTSTDVFCFFCQVLPNPLGPKTEHKSSTGSLANIRVCFLVFFATALHLTLTSMFGLSLFSDQSQAGCTHITSISMDVLVLGPKSRPMWLAHAMFLPPFFNVILLWFIIFIVRLLVAHMWWPGAWVLSRRMATLPMSDVIREFWTQYRDGFSRNVYPPCTIISVTSIKFLVILLTEHTIRRNTSQAAEGEWTFGQILALFLTLPIILKTIYDSFAARRKYDGTTKNEGGNKATNRPDQAQPPWPLEKRSLRSHEVKLNIADEIHAQSDESDVEPDE